MPALVFRLQPITGLTYRNPQGDNFGLYKHDRSFLVREISLAIIIVDNARALHNSYFLKEDGLFFSSKALGLVFSATYLRGSPARLA